MTEPVVAQDYPERALLVGSMMRLLKAARRPLLPEHELAALDDDGEADLERIADKLARHLHFEHVSREQIENALHDGVRQYRAINGKRPPNRQVAADMLDSMARAPMQRKVYLGITNLKLPHGTVVGGVTFLEPTRDPELASAFEAGSRRTVPELVCEVEVTAGTDDLLFKRARGAAEIALGLVRQHNLFGFMAKIYREQVLYGFDGTWAWREGETMSHAGWWRENPNPLPMELDHPNGVYWRTQLSELSELYAAVAPDLRQRVDTCIEWLDVAALSNRWRIIIPAVFSGMEALLVPETSGLKGEVVTVRSVAVHLALEHRFLHPGEIMFGYGVRSELVHGNPARDFPEAEITSFAESRRGWAFRVLCDYLELATNLGTKTVEDLVAHLDRGACKDVCKWLEQYGGSKIVNKYRELVPAPATPADEAPTSGASEAASDCEG